MKKNLKFEEIIDDLKQGKVATREPWSNSIFVFMRLSVAFQQPDLDKLNHVPPLLLQIVKQREQPFVDGFHLCILFPDNVFYPFTPSTADLFDNNWIVLDLDDVVNPTGFSEDRPSDASIEAALEAAIQETIRETIQEVNQQPDSQEMIEEPVAGEPSCIGNK